MAACSALSSLGAAVVSDAGLVPRDSVASSSRRAVVSFAGRPSSSALALEAGARPLSTADIWTSSTTQAGLHRECNSSNHNRSSVSFASRRSSIAGAIVSLNHSNGHSAARIVGAAAGVPSSGSRVVRAVAAEKSVETVNPTSTAGASQKTEYHFLVANAKFMLDEEEHFQELMRERLRYFGEQDKEQDFWLVIEPEFLAKFPDVTSRLGRPAVALVSTDATWITFMKLRLDRVLKGSYEADTIAEALAGGNSSVEIKFQKPERWTAPYTKYEGPWWTPFLPPQ